MAWLDAKPGKSKTSRRESFSKLDEDHLSLQMPDIETDYKAGYIVGLLQEAGLMSFAGMGPVPLSWADICAWEACTGRELGVWEKSIVNLLSKHYVSQYSDSGVNSEPPYVKEAPIDVEEIDREAVEDKILSIFRSRKQAS